MIYEEERCRDRELTRSTMFHHRKGREKAQPVTVKVGEESVYLWLNPGTSPSVGIDQANE